MRAKPSIEPLTGQDEASECARMMVASEPWLTLGLSFEGAAATLADPAKEGYASRDEKGVSGFVVLDRRGLLNGYIQILCVRPDCRGQGLGSSLIEWAEEQLFRSSPNVFICVSSFNSGARRLYERHGFQLVGALHEFLVSGHDEMLLRKTKGSWTTFRGKSA